VADDFWADPWLNSAYRSDLASCNVYFYATFAADPIDLFFTQTNSEYLPFYSPFSIYAQKLSEEPSIRISRSTSRHAHPSLMQSLRRRDLYSPDAMPLSQNLLFLARLFRNGGCDLFWHLS
jgi:hypothetical protein